MKKRRALVLVGAPILFAACQEIPTDTRGETPLFSVVVDVTITPLGTLGGNVSQANAITPQGHIAGVSTTAAVETRAFLLDGTMMNLGALAPPGAVNVASFATDVNGHGQVVGRNVFTLDGVVQSRAFLWTAGGGMDDLGTLGGDQSDARAINDLGQVAGQARTASGAFHAFLWTRADLGRTHAVRPSLRRLTRRSAPSARRPEGRWAGAVQTRCHATGRV